MPQMDFGSVLTGESLCWPFLQPQDAAKLLYQHAYGPEHALTEPAEALDRLRQEWAKLTATMSELTGEPVDASIGISAGDPIGNDYARLHLRPLIHLPPEHAQTMVWRLFTATAAWAASRTPKPELIFTRGLQQLDQLAAEGALPFADTEWQAYRRQWADAGYPAPRHSERYRAQARPAYRIVEAAALPVLPLLLALEALLADSAPNRRLIVALDGPSGSGKSRLGRLLSRWFASPVLAMDDFFLRPEQRTPGRLAEPGGNLDRERFASEVLQPLRAGEPFRYRPYNCQTQKLGPPRDVQPARLTFIEGSYSHHPAFAAAYDLKVFLTISSQNQKQRILKRNGSEQLKRFESEWIPLENRYFEAFDVRGQSDLVLPAD